jgi:hypothetical protein
MKEHEFNSFFYDIKSKREKQVSDLYWIIIKFEEKINNYNNLLQFDKLLINNLLTHSIIISNSNLQWFLEDITDLFEKFILKNDISINSLDKNIYDLFYNKYDKLIIRDYLVYWEKISTKDLWNFIPKNQYWNIILRNWTSNTVNFNNLKEILKILFIDIEIIISKISIDINDYKKIDNRVWLNYILKNKNKIKFFNKIIYNLNERRNEIAHWKILKSDNIKYNFELFLLVKKYYFGKFILELELLLRNNIRNNTYLK